MASDAAAIAIRNYSFIKGRLAEAIVERLFISLGMEVYPVGFEAQLPRVATLRAHGKIKTSAIRRFEYGPDFVVCAEQENPKTYALYEIEVKFRQNGKIDLQELNKYEDPDMYFILIDETGIYCLKKAAVSTLEIKTVEITKGRSAKGISFEQCPRLEDVKDFSFSRAQKNCITAFTGIVQASLGSFVSHGKFSKDLDEKYKGLIDLEIINEFNDK